MLKKLFKYEFKSTAKIMLILYAILIITTSVGSVVLYSLDLEDVYKRQGQRPSDPLPLPSELKRSGIRDIVRLPENRKFRNRTDGGKFFEAKFMYFFHAAAGIPFRVSSTFGLSRSVSDNPQTMSGLSGVPNGTSSQTL